MTDAERRPPRRRPIEPPSADAETDYTIGELAGALGVTRRAIRFYEAKGLLTPDRRGVARTYNRRDCARLSLILRGKNLGFSLDDIKRYLELYDADPAQIAQVRMLAAKVDQHIAELEKKRADVDRTLAELRDIRRQIVSHLEGQDGEP